MTSDYRGGDMDSAAVMSEVETAIFAIITSAGEARASLYEALEKARAGQMVESQQCMSQADMQLRTCLLYTSPSPRDQRGSRMPSSA